MIHPHCKDRGDHNWDDWEARPCRSDGVEVKVFPDGSYECPPAAAGKMYHYRRECQNMGCDAKQYAERLEPAGRNEIVDHGGSEEFYIDDEMDGDRRRVCPLCLAEAGECCRRVKAGFIHLVRRERAGW